jgi:hypothetical protein
MTEAGRLKGRAGPGDRRRPRYRRIYGRVRKRRHYQEYLEIKTIGLPA